MNKYTREQLRSMARTTLTARDNGDGRYFQMIMSLCLALNMGAEQIEQKIEDLAQ